MRFLLLIAIVVAFIGCGEDDVETIVIPYHPCPTEDSGDWTHLVTLPRHDLQPGSFRITDEWSDAVIQSILMAKIFCSSFTSQQ